MRQYDVEELILGMAELVYENRALRKRLEEYKIESSLHRARLYGKDELAKKLAEQQTENMRYNAVQAKGWSSSDEFRTLDEMDLTEEEREICKSY